MTDESVAGIETSGTDEPTCPYCGDTAYGGDLEGDSGEVICGDCGQVYEYTRDVAITYSTNKVPTPDPA